MSVTIYRDPDCGSSRNTLAMALDILPVGQKDPFTKEDGERGKTVFNPNANPYQSAMIPAVGGLEREMLILSCTDLDRVLKET